MQLELMISLLAIRSANKCTAWGVLGARVVIFCVSREIREVKMCHNFLDVNAIDVRKTSLSLSVSCIARLITSHFASNVACLTE